MTVAFLVAVAVLGLPVLALGVVLGPLCGRHPAARALGPVAALALLVLALRVLSRLGLYGDARLAALLVVGAAAAAACVVLRRPVRWALPPSLAALAVVVLFALPLLDRPSGTVLGYNEINDSHFHASVIAWLADGAPAVPDLSSTAETVTSVEGGYPIGGHELAALVVPVTPDGTLGAYQPALALVVSFGAFVAWWALRRAGVGPWLAALGGVVAAGGYLQYGFYSEALLPQMMATPLVFAAVGLGVEAVASRRIGPAVLSATTTVAAVLVYSLGVGAYLGPALAALAAVGVVRSAYRARLVLGLAAACAVAAVIVLVALRPLAEQSVDFIREARSTLDDPNPAHLPAAADRRLVWGSWVGPDLRFPYERTRETEVGIALAVVLAIAGLVACVRRRSFPLLALLGAALAGYALIRANASIYWVAKSYQMLAFPIACLVVVGASWLAARRLPRLPAAAPAFALLLLGGYVAAAWRSLDAARAGTAYSNAEVAELDAFADAGSQGLGLGLIHDDLAKTELRTLDNTWHLTYSVRDSGIVPARDRGWHVVDVDMVRPDRLAGHDYIVEPRLGGLSQPGPPFRLAAVTESFRLWRRPPEAQPPEGRAPTEPAGTTAGLVLAPGASTELVGVGLPAIRVGVRPRDSFLVRAEELDATGSMWARWPTTAVHWYSVAGGSRPARAEIDVTVPGRYRVVVSGAMADDFRLVLDGGASLRPERPTRRQNRDATQYLGTVELAAGVHAIELYASTSTTEGRQTSYVQAVSLERDPPAPPAPVCAGRERLEASWERPLEVSTDEGRVDLVNCGEQDLLVDWVEPVPGD